MGWGMVDPRETRWWRRQAGRERFWGALSDLCLGRVWGGPVGWIWLGRGSVTLSWGSNGSSFQLLSCVQLFATPWTAACEASLSITYSWSLLKLMSIESVMPSNHLILSHSLLLLLSIFPSIRVFPNESVLGIRWSKDWSFSFNISPSNEYSGLIYFRMNWLDLLAIQGTLKSLLQHHSSKASIIWCSAFFITNSHIHPWLLEKTKLWVEGPLLAK